MDASHMNSAGDSGNKAAVTATISRPSTPAGFLWRGNTYEGWTLDDSGAGVR